MCTTKFCKGQFSIGCKEFEIPEILSNMLNNKYVITNCFTVARALRSVLADRAIVHASQQFTHRPTLFIHNEHSRNTGFDLIHLCLKRMGYSPKYGYVVSIVLYPWLSNPCYSKSNYKHYQSLLYLMKNCRSMWWISLSNNRLNTGLTGATRLEPLAAHHHPSWRHKPNCVMAVLLYSLYSVTVLPSSVENLKDMKLEFL